MKPEVIEYNNIKYVVKDVGMKLVKDYGAKSLQGFRVDLKTKTVLFEILYPHLVKVIPIRIQQFKNIMRRNCQ